jgi:acetyl esterase/lipase
MISSSATSNSVKKMAALLMAWFATPFALAQEPRVIHLWQHGAPGFESLKDEPEQAQEWWVKHINNPSMVVFQPAKEIANGTVVLIAPGGGHKELVYTAEGVDAALFLNKLGITAVVLKYRLARELDSPYSLELHPQQDAYRAMRLLRRMSKELNIDSNRIGMMGFSAGGEVVASVAYGSGDGDAKALDAVDRLNGKPNFQILVYPGPLWVPTSIDGNAPPAFMVAAMDDACCAKPIIDLAQLYHAAKIPAEIHLYARGNHAFNMGQRTPFVSVRNWPERLAEWLKDSGYLAPRKDSR